MYRDCLFKTPFGWAARIISTETGSGCSLPDGSCVCWENSASGCDKKGYVSHMLICQFFCFCQDTLCDAGFLPSLL